MTPSITSEPRPPQLSLLPEVELTEAEARVFRRREKLTTSQWAEKYRVVTDGPWEGPWRNEHTPYLVEPMDTWDRRGVRKVVVVGTPQSGKTQIAYNCWAKGVDQDQAASLITMADKDTAHKVNRDRLQPIIEASPRLARLKTGRAEDLGLDRLALQGSITYLAWATSVTRMQTMPFEHVFGDEVDLYKGWSEQQQKDPVSMLESRTTTFRYTGKTLLVSIVFSEHGPIWRNLMLCQEIRVFMARCPHCGEYQIMRKEQLRWDDSLSDPDRLEAEGLGWYECEHCQAPWGEAERRQAVKAGAYRPHLWDAEERWWKPATAARRPIKVGFHFSAFYSPFVPLGEIAAQAMRAQDDPQADQDLHHKYLALPWKSERAAREEDHVLALCDHRPPGLVPTDAVALTAGVDVQLRVIYYAIRAWAPGPDEESWLVRAGMVQSFAGLTKVMFEVIYQDLQGERVVLDYGLVDARYRRKEVLAWCAEHAPFRPSMGWERLRTLVRLAKADDQYPGLLRHDINVTAWKDVLDRKLKTPAADPGAFHLHSNTDESGHELLLADYARQLCAEAPDERGLWRQINNRPNHWLDCEVLNLVCAYMLELRFLEPEPAPAPPAASPTPERRSNRW
jgi:phage terminase large subunit GpA-like protein